MFTAEVVLFLKFIPALRWKVICIRYSLPREGSSIFHPIIRSKQHNFPSMRNEKEFYFGDQPVSEDNILSYVDFFSDVFFVHSSLWAVQLHIEAGHEEVYLYEYSFTDGDTPTVPYTNVRGANHCSQSLALVDGKNVTYIEEDNLTDEYRNMKQTIRELWHNFITTGKPVPDGSSLPSWPPVKANRSPHMSIGQKIELRGTLSKERAEFWESIYHKYYREPIPPPDPLSKIHSEL